MKFHKIHHHHNDNIKFGGYYYVPYDDELFGEVLLYTKKPLYVGRQKKNLPSVCIRVYCVCIQSCISKNRLSPRKTTVCVCICALERPRRGKKMVLGGQNGGNGNLNIS